MPTEHDSDDAKSSGAPDKPDTTSGSPMAAGSVAPLDHPGDLRVGGSARIASDLTVGGDLRVGGSATIASDLTVGGTLRHEGALVSGRGDHAEYLRKYDEEEELARAHDNACTHGGAVVGAQTAAEVKAIDGAVVGGGGGSRPTQRAEVPSEVFAMALSLASSVTSPHLDEQFRMLIASLDAPTMTRAGAGAGASGRVTAYGSLSSQVR